MLCSNAGSIILLYFLLIIFGAICMLMQKISDLVRMLIPIVSFVEKDVKIIYSVMRNNEFKMYLKRQLNNRNVPIDKISESN